MPKKGPKTSVEMARTEAKISLKSDGAVTERSTGAGFLEEVRE